MAKMAKVVEKVSRAPEANAPKREFSKFFNYSASAMAAACISLTCALEMPAKWAFSAETKKAGITEGQTEGKQILFNRDVANSSRDKMAEASAFKEPEVAQKGTRAEVKQVVKFSQLQETLENALNSFKNAAKYDEKRFTITVENQAETGKGTGFIIYAKDKAFGEDRFRVREKDIGKLGKVERLEETPGTKIDSEKQVVRMHGMEIERLGKIENPDEKEVRIEIDAEKQVVRIYWDISQTFGNKPKTEIAVEEDHLSIKRAKPEDDADTKRKLFRKFNTPKKQE